MGDALILHLRDDKAYAFVDHPWQRIHLLPALA